MRRQGTDQFIRIDELTDPERDVPVPGRRRPCRARSAPARLCPAPRRGAAGKRSLGVFDGDMTCPWCASTTSTSSVCPACRRKHRCRGRWHGGDDGRRDRPPKSRGGDRGPPTSASPRLRVRALVSSARGASHPDVIQTGGGRRAFRQTGCLSGSTREQRGAICDASVTAGPGGDGPPVRRCRSLPDVGRRGAPLDERLVGTWIDGCGGADVWNTAVYQPAGMRFLWRSRTREGIVVYSWNELPCGAGIRAEAVCSSPLDGDTVPECLNGGDPRRSADVRPPWTCPG
jgi:hypothetical protein